MLTLLFLSGTKSRLLNGDRFLGALRWSTLILEREETKLSATVRSYLS
jgi:hypothetical protein